MEKKIIIPNHIKITQNDLKNKLFFEGKKGNLILNLNSYIIVNIIGNSVILTNNLLKKNKSKEIKKYMGLYYSLIKTNIKGVSQSFKTHLYLQGLGFKVEQVENVLKFKLGFSHNILIDIPKNIKVKVVKNNQIILYSISKEELTQFASIIKKLKKVEPYKGKGILLKNEKIIRKEGKKNKK